MTQFTDHDTDVAVAVTVMNDNVEVSCVEKRTNIVLFWYSVFAVLFVIFMKVYRAFSTFFTVIFYSPKK